MQANKELLIRHVILLDPASGQSQTCDIYINDGKIAQLAPEIEPQNGWEIFESEGAYASVGWVDAHTHFELEHQGANFVPNKTYAQDGVTYIVDAGSYGPAKFERTHNLIQQMVIPAKAYLHVAADGASFLGKELTTHDQLVPEHVLATYAQYKTDIIGIKIRIDPRVNTFILESLRQAKEIANALHLPLIIHPTRCPENLEDILPYLQKNDVYAHTYSRIAPCILDENGIVRDCVRQARERGVWFDLSHGSNNFSFDVAQKAMAQDFVVDTISTDLHAFNITKPVRCIADVMSKMLYLGMSLQDILYRVTVAPVKMLGLTDKNLEVKVGQTADLTIFRVEEGLFKFTDCCKNEVAAQKAIRPILTVYGEQVFNPRAGIYMRNIG